jgi:hypothetical protein
MDVPWTTALASPPLSFAGAVFCNVSMTLTKANGRPCYLPSVYEGEDGASPGRLRPETDAIVHLQSLPEDRGSADPTGPPEKTAKEHQSNSSDTTEAAKAMSLATKVAVPRGRVEAARSFQLRARNTLRGYGGRFSSC